jgi:hypothetical protein
MYKYIISSLIAFVMIASFMLFWSPLTETGVALVEDDCPPIAICACAGKWTGYMRNVPCDCECDCTLSPPDTACAPHRCSRYETPLVLQPYPYTSVDGDGVICAFVSCEVVCGDALE